MVHPLLDIRAWHKVKRRMYYLSDESTFRIKLGPGFNVIFEKQPDPRWMYKLMFFSGIFDETNQKIYSGDVIGKVKPEYVVFFDSGRFQLEPIDGGKPSDLHDLQPRRNRYYVLGNIHENEELLK